MPVYPIMSSCFRCVSKNVMIQVSMCRLLLGCCFFEAMSSKSCLCFGTCSAGSVHDFVVLQVVVSMLSLPAFLLLSRHGEDCAIYTKSLCCCKRG